LAPDCDRVAAQGAAQATAHAAAAGPLPSATAPLLDISAEVHASWEVRLFVS
jgi:urease accessory protein